VNDTELNLRFNTLMTMQLLSLILSWLTPYPWWQDTLITLALGASVALPLVMKK
jgi:hypothetical protein